AARVLKEHQREQALILSLPRHQLAKYTGQSNGLGAEIAANELFTGCCGVSFIEDQVEDRLHRGETLGKYFRRRNRVGDARILNLSLSAHQALSECRFGNEEGASNLRSSQSAEGSQRERHLRLLIDCRMAAGEDKPQAVVRKMHGFGIDLRFMVRL